MVKVRIKGLFVYPVKGMRGVACAEAQVTSRGLAQDRRFMLVDPDGRFITQRERPELATYAPYWSNDDRLTIFDGSLQRAVSVTNFNSGPRLQVQVWKDTVEAIVQHPDVNEQLSQALKAPVRLVYLPDTTERLAHKQCAPSERVLNSFSDGFPFLLTSEESLADLNARIGARSGLPMERFRPNIVVAGCTKPFQEDTWRHFRVAGITFFGMKRSARCVVTTTNQETGVRAGKEPLKTLTRYRRFGTDACFGMNLNHAGQGSLCVGDRVEVFEYGQPWFSNS